MLGPPWPSTGKGPGPPGFALEVAGRRARRPIAEVASSGPDAPQVNPT